MAIKTNKDMYLVGYNVFQTTGWLYILIKILLHVMKTSDFQGMWDEVNGAVQLFQTLAYLEVLHCILRYVPSSAFLTFVQISSRVMVVWGIFGLVPEVKVTFGVPLLLFAWSLAEITRYSYYAANIIGCCPYTLTWCRYSFFYVLYPAGVTGELWSMWSAIPYIKEKNLYSISMPNPANFSFHYYFLVQAVMLSYIPGFPQLFMYMISQRTKVLNKSKQN